MNPAKAVRNRLPEAAIKFSALNVSGAWFANNANVQTEESEFWPDDPSYKQIAFTGGVVLTISAVNLNAEDDLEPIELAFAAKMQSGGTITVALTDSASIGASTVTSNFVVDPQPESSVANALSDLSWAVYRTDPITVNKLNLSVPRMDIQVSLAPTDASDTVYFANPVLSGTLDHGRYSEAARQMVPAIPRFFIETNGTENPPSAVTRFIDVAFVGLDAAVKAFRDYRFFTVADGRDETHPETLSDLVWPSDAGLDEAKWLTQFSGTEPVSKLSSTLDPSDPFILNTSNLNGPNTLRFSTTGINDPPMATVEITRDFLRWQAEHGYYGMNAGSIAAVRESVKRVMLGAKEVTITLQDDGPFTVLIETPWEQTYGASEEEVGNASSVVIEALSRARPIGVKIIHQLT